MNSNFVELNKRLQELIEENQQLKAQLQKQNLIQKVFDNAPVGIFIADARGNFIDVNEGFSSILGMTLDDLRGKSFRDITPAVDLEAEVEMVRTMISQKLPKIQFEKRYITANKGLIYVFVHISVLYDKNQQPQYLIGTVEDITHKKHIELELIRSEEAYRKTSVLLQSVLDAIPDIIGIQDTEHRIIKYNKAGFDFLKKTENEVYGKKCYELIGRKNQCDICSTSECIKTKKTAQHEQFFPELGVWLDMRSYPILDDAGNIHYIIEHLRDITKVKQIEIQLRESQEKYKLLVENQLDVIVKFDKQGKFTFVSPSFCKIIGRTETQLLNNTPVEFIVEQDIPKTLSAIEQTYFAPYNSYVEHRVISPQGIRWFGWIINAVIENNEVIEFIATGRDITDKKELELQLKERERFLSTLISNLPGIAYRCKNTPDWDMIFISDGAQEITGYSAKDIMSNNPSFGNLIVEEDRQPVWDKVQKNLELRQQYDLLYRILTADNKIKWMWERAQGVFDDNDNLLYIEGFITDITEQIIREQKLKENEAELKQQNEEYIAINEELRQTNDELIMEKQKSEEKERQLQLIADNLQDAMIYQIIVIDETTRKFTYISKNVEKFYGYTVEQALTNSSLIYSKIHPDDIQNFIEQENKALNEFKQFKHIARVINPDGTIRWSLFVSSPRQVNDSVIWDGIEIDITQQKLLEQELTKTKAIAEENADQFRKLFENLEQGFALHQMIYDENHKPIDYRFIMVNNAFKKLTRQLDFDIVGMTVKQVFPQTEDYWIKIYAQVAQKGVPIRFENYSREFDKYYDVVAYSPKKDFFAVIFNDITKNKKYEQQLINAKIKAEEADRLKTSFLHNISHEIRTPLNAICGFSQLLKDETIDTEKRKQFADIIINSGYQLNAIIDDIVSMSILETGKIKPKLQHFSIYDLIDDIYNYNKIKAKNKNIELIVKHPLVKLENIYSDKTKLTQILNNLVTNAVKFTEKGYVEIGYEFKNNFIEFYVKDTGIGIEKEAQHKIFERFTQANPDIATKYGGTGLGLAIAKAYVEILGGTIWFESELNRGSTFYFNIPLNLNIDIKKKINALLIDNDIANIITLTEIFANNNINPLVIDNEPEVIKFFADRHDIDIVFFALRPSFTKYNLTISQIHYIDKKLPIIALVDQFDNEEKKYLLRNGVSEYLALPLEEKIIKKIIKLYLKS